MPKNTSLGLLAVLVLILGMLAQSRTVTANERSCGDKTIEGSLPLVRGKVFVADVTIQADCTISVAPTRELTTTEIKAAAKETARAQHSNARRPLHPIGDRGPVDVDPEYHMDSHIWDCCNIVMTQLHTDLTWTTNGSTITGWNAGGWTTNHPEGWPSCGSGWQLVNSFLIQYAGGTGSSFIEVQAHAEWSYAGVFDCGGTLYYNVFNNYVYGWGSGGGSCYFSYSLRNTHSGWHLQAYCNDPYTVVFDQSW